MRDSADTPLVFRELRLPDGEAERRDHQHHRITQKPLAPGALETPCNDFALDKGEGASP